MTSKEDEIVQSYLQAHRELEETEKSDAFFYTETHYNDYGNRGVVDAYYGTADEATVLEVKSESAVRGATGANEILRQYNRMRESFFQGTEYDSARYKVHFELCFEMTKSNLAHVRANADLFRSAVEQIIPVPGTQHVSNFVCMRESGEDVLTPLILFQKTTESPEERVVDYRTQYEDVPFSFSSYVESNFPTFYANAAELIEKMDSDGL